MRHQSAGEGNGRRREEVFAELVTRHRHELHLHCYRMLGSVSDADDLLQETMIAAWRGLDGFLGNSSPRAWLYRIATNRCLNAIRDSKRRAPVAPVAPFDPPAPSRHGDVTWLQPYPDAWLSFAADPSARYEVHETVQLAFIAALQRLPARQTAAVILCDVLDFPLADVATMLQATPTAVKGLLQRARATLGCQHLAPLATVPEPGSTADAHLARRFADAFSADDVDAVVALLTDDAWLAMPPAPHVYCGSDAIAGFLRASAAGRAGRHLGLLPTRANTQPAFACYLGDPAAQPSGLIVLTIKGDRIAVITRFIEPRLTSIFGFAGPRRDGDVVPARAMTTTPALASAVPMYGQGCGT